MPLALWGLEAAYHQSLSDGCLQFGVWLEAWFFALGTLFFVVFLYRVSASLFCIRLLGNMAKVDLSMLDLEWFFEKEEDEEEKNKGNFVCLQLQPTSHAHNFL